MKVCGVNYFFQKLEKLRITSRCDFSDAVAAKQRQFKVRATSACVTDYVRISALIHIFRSKHNTRVGSSIN
jgi:hypothetical protein